MSNKFNLKQSVEKLILFIFMNPDHPNMIIRQKVKVFV